MFRLKSIVAASLILFATGGLAQTPPTPPTPPPALPYGPPITMQAAKRAMAAAELEAAKNTWAVAIAIVDSGGQLVMLHRLDNVQHASIRIAQGKARTALEFRRETKALEEAIARGGAGLRLLALDDVDAARRRASRSWPTARSSARSASRAWRPHRTRRSRRRGADAAK